MNIAKNKKMNMPIRARIEVCRHCNLRCVSCPVGRDRIRNKTTMSFSDFKKIIKKISPDIKELSMFNYGEPLMHPEISKMIKFAKNSGIKKIIMHSNGMLLTEKLSKALVESGLDEISIGVDGASNSTYKKYRVGGNFDTLLSNIRDLVNVKKTMGAKKPIIGAQFIVMRHNQGEIEKFSGICKKLGVDKIIYKTFNAHMSGHEDSKKNLKFMPTDVNYSRYETLKAEEISNNYKPKHCMWAWENIVINANGDIALCCQDYNADFNLGNILQDKNWWKTEGRKKIQQTIAGIENNVGICNHCTLNPYLKTEKL